MGREDGGGRERRGFDGGKEVWRCRRRALREWFSSGKSLETQMLSLWGQVTVLATSSLPLLAPANRLAAAETEVAALLWNSKYLMMGCCGVAHRRSLN